MYGDTKKKMAKQENKQIKKADKSSAKTYKKVTKSTGLEYEPKVKARHSKPLTKMQSKKLK